MKEPETVSAEADGDPIRADVRKIEHESGIPTGFMEALFREDDWSFVIKTHAVPDAALICNCHGVTKAQIIEAVLGGARSVSAVCEATRASTNPHCASPVF